MISKLMDYLGQLAEVLDSTRVAASPEKHISVEAANLWYQALLSKYEVISHANDTIDTKSTVLATISLALVTLVLTSSKFEIDAVAIAGMVLLGLCALVSIAFSRVGESVTPVNSHDERPDYYRKTDEEFVWQLIPDIEEATRKISKINRRKSKGYGTSLGLLVTGVLLLAVSQYVTIAFK